MDSRWSTARGRLALVGQFGDVAAHHHPAVQIGLGLDADLHVRTATGRLLQAPLVIVASGVRHALHTGDQPAVAVYLRPDRGPGARLNALCRQNGDADGVWALDISSDLADRSRDSLRRNGLDAVVDQLLDELTARPGPREVRSHPQLRHAIDLLGDDGPSDLATLARAVGLSPDYLGRLFARQTGASYAATARWARLLTAFGHLTRGASVTDAAHLAGFSDGAHATRACRELTGATPRDLVRALRR